MDIIMEILTHKNLFNYKDYLELNKDLIDLNNKEDAEKHWIDIGLNQMRLCNKNQLEITNEFGCEVILYIPYYYYLYKNKLLFDNKIKTYKGMKPFYYFVNDNCIIEKENNRVWVPSNNRPLLINDNEHVKNFNETCWIQPPYKSIYKNNIILFEKPILVIHNKYNIEWRIDVYNFFSIDILRTIFSKLCDKYQIIYIRPSNKIIDKNFSYDHNIILDNFEDNELIENEFKDKVITYENLIKRFDYTYNELLLMLYSNCENYISIQGGSSHFISYFYNKMIVLHKRGSELDAGCYDGWYKNNYKEENKTLIICKNEDEITQNLSLFE